MLHPRPRKKSINTVNANNSARSTLESNKLVLNGFDVEEKNDGCYRAKPTKKRKSFNKRECSDPERIKIKMLDDFQKRAQLNSVSVMHDGYYSSQPAITGLGQLHSVPSSGSHHEMQHSMQGPLQGQLTFRTPTVQGFFDLQDSLEAMEQPIRVSQFHGITSKQLDVDRSLS
ncbi:hypothetical protein JHK86_008655 [Glycine max]|nr:hypothetical protein JHK86_008655 [Glycine max]